MAFSFLGEQITQVVANTSAQFAANRLSQARIFGVLRSKPQYSSQHAANTVAVMRNRISRARKDMGQSVHVGRNRAEAKTSIG